MMNDDLCGFKVGEFVQLSDSMFGRVVRPAKEKGVLVVAFQTFPGRSVEMCSRAADLIPLIRQEKENG